LHRRKIDRGNRSSLFLLSMVQQTAANHLESLIRSAFDEGKCGEYYIVDLIITPTHHIGVFIDGDKGVSLDTCTQISRILEAVLDAEPSLGGLYELEVSSPGVSRPLKFLRQYLKHVNRTLRIMMNGGEEVEGKLMSTGQDSITIEIKPLEKKGVPETREIPFGDIKEAYVTVQFGKK
jgi:ribosome maturation factor RimP